MITINGEEKYTIDLNECQRQKEFELEIVSKDKESTLNWGIDSVLCSGLEYTVGYDSLHLLLDVKKILTTSYVIIRNSKNETARVQIIPDEEEINEKTYVFKTGKTSTSGRTATITIISKRNGKNWDWNISYGGSPIAYDFNVSKTKLVIKNMSNFREKVSGFIELSQLDSNKKIIINLLHNSPEETEILNIKKVD